MKKLLFLLLFAPLFTQAQIGFRPEGTITITSGSSTTVSNGVGLVLVNPASVLLTHTITLPSAPHDRDMIVIQFGGTILSTAPVVTTLTIAAAGGTSILTNLTSFSSGLGGMCLIYIYNNSLSAWFRLL